MDSTLMSWVYLFACFIHDLSVAVYVGGAVAMEFVLAPAQKAIPPAQAQVMGEKTSDRFLVLVWLSLFLILITGLFRLFFKGMIFGETLLAPQLALSESYGRTLLAMAIIWTLLTINGALITFIYRPRLKGKLGAGTTQSQATQDRDAKVQAATMIQTLTRVDLVLATTAVLFGASLLWGGLL